MNQRRSFRGTPLSARSAFTLIELLVVIAIIATLAVVVVLTLNPSELLKQSRDANRVSDMATLNSALGLYQSDVSNGAMGSSSVIYASLLDPNTTSTAGGGCGAMGLPTLASSSYSYHCAASSTYRNASTTGWIPLAFTSLSTGSPFGSLPIDPVNSSSSRLFYSYATNGSQYEVTSGMESSKYRLGGGNDVISSDGGSLSSVYEKGSKLGLMPLDYGDSALVGYWPLSEGTGTVAYDWSGGGDSVTWSGTQAGSSTYYSPARAGQWAGYFNGSNDYINLGSPSQLAGITGPFSVVGWIYESSMPSSSSQMALISNSSGYKIGGFVFGLTISGGFLSLGINQSGGASGVVTTSPIPIGQWDCIAATFNGSTATVYMNGVAVGSAASPAPAAGGTTYIGNTAQGGWTYFPGLVSGVRVYNRALSAAEIQALYNSGK